MQDLLGAPDDAPRLPASASLPAAAPSASTAKTYTGAAVAADPLGMLSKPAQAADGSTPPAASQSAPKSRAEQLEDFMAAQMPSKGKEVPAPVTGTASSAAAAGATQAEPSEKPSRLTVTIQSREDKDKVTWYKLLVNDEKGQRTTMKRYNDFKEFDTNMREKSTVLNRVIPQLPPGGALGLRHKLNVGDFNDKRQEGLEQWLQSLAKNCKRQIVEDFLFKGQVTQEEALPQPHDENHDEVKSWT